jgi:hypothetical protein
MGLAVWDAELKALDKYKKSPGRFSMIFTEIELTDDMSGWKVRKRNYSRCSLEEGGRRGVTRGPIRGQAGPMREDGGG